MGLGRFRLAGGVRVFSAMRRLAVPLLWLLLTAVAGALPAQAQSSRPVITNVDPQSGSVEESTVVVITLQNLSLPISVSFGGVDVTDSVTTLNATTIAAFTPEVETPGPVDIVVTTPDGSDTPANGFRYLSNDATLSGLAMNQGPLSPTFASGTFAYSAQVPNALTAVTFIPTASDDGATITVDGTEVDSGTASGPVSLDVGPNEIDIVVTAEDGGGQVYTVVVTRLPPTPPAITSITPPSGSIDGFTQVMIEGENLDDVTSVTFGGVEASDLTIYDSSILSVFTPVGSAVGTVDVVVTSPDGNDTVVGGFRYLSKDATLSALAMNEGPISPSFTPETTVYSAQVPNALTAVRFTPTASQAGATISVEGSPVASGTLSNAIPLVVGPNAVDIVVNSEDEFVSKTYTVLVTREAPSLQPVIQTIVNLSGPETGGQSVTIQGLNFTGATSVTFGGSEADFEVIDDGEIVATTPPHAAGPVDVVVTSPQGSDTAANGYLYTAAPPSTDLSTLLLNEGDVAFDPAFSPGTTSYTASVPALTSFVKVTASAAGWDDVTMTVHGTECTREECSVLVSLDRGPNTINIVVDNGVTEPRTYTIVVTRLPPVPEITGITPGSGPITGGNSVTISGEELSNASSVTFGGETATITANTPTLIQVEAPAHAAGVVDVVVTSPGGSATAAGAYTYQEADEGGLSGLTLSAGTLDPPFSPEVINYTVSVPYAQSLLGITPTAADDVALTVNGVSPWGSGFEFPLFLNEGPNTITIVAEHAGDERTYTITVTREPLGPATITSVTPSSGPAGSPVTFSGSGFYGSLGGSRVFAINVVHGGTSSFLTAYNVKSDTEIAAVMPDLSGYEGPVSIELVTSDGNFTSEDVFTYTASAPATLTLNPPAGPSPADRSAPPMIRC